MDAQFIQPRGSIDVVHAACWPPYQARKAQRDAQGKMASMPLPEITYTQLPRVHRFKRCDFCGKLLQVQ